MFKKVFVGFVFLYFVVWYAEVGNKDYLDIDKFLENNFAEQEPILGGPIIKVWNSQEQKLQSMELEEYLIGVLAEEVPTNFEFEAIKAQAVAARTYALRRLQMAKTVPKRHPDGDICTASSHCQGWKSEAELKSRWGTQYKAKIKILRRAIVETQGEVIKYQGELIDPVYHSTSGGPTENAKDLWGKDVPYLQSVECRWDQESPRFKDAQAFSFTELNQRLSLQVQAIPVSATSRQGRTLINIIEKTKTGRVKTLSIGNKIFDAKELRTKLGLKSTRMDYRMENGKVVFLTIGNGHGVGLCQYGANGMAKEGKKYIDILTHYYTGVKIIKQKGRW